MPTKEIYEAPAVEVVEVNAEGMVCGSQGDQTDYVYYGDLDEIIM